MQGAKPKGLITAALVALSACAGPPVSDTAGPQLEPANPATAANLFAAGCLRQLPSFAGTRAALASLPITQRRDSGIYYHNTQNLSLKIISGTGAPVCEVVYGTTGSRAQVEQAFIQAVPGPAPTVPGDVLFDFTPGPDNTNFYSVSVKAQ